ncbi:DUF2510 domain-containing protein [Arthrobacter sp. A2-55]|uniref:DUF2510 domain-containing protein n=1 Tax=Arthrobacter sp. A2-55 TaxID=2897337 RepID=UPI0021CD757E|nr:DUF2510 domain-containing protein [Arthrobacter sp. A2-55]MCU6481406.1 DUF2510 domain-containing protein [Arthrobacter sp. A2-55]
MSSTEWQKRVRAMVLSRAYSEEQWRLLSNARIEGADGALLEWQNELNKLTAHQFFERMNYALERNPALHSEAMNFTSPGWHDDGSGRQRWWDGRQWTEHLQADRVRVLADRSTVTPAGWYDDGSGRRRWWDGRQWTKYSG